MALEKTISGRLGQNLYKDDAIEATSSVSQSPIPSPKSLKAASLSRSSSEIDLSAVREAVDKLTVTEADDEHMFRALEDIFRDAQVYERSINPDFTGTENLWSHLRDADAASERGTRDIQALGIIQKALSQMVWNESRLVVVAARTLADAARDSTWRIPFGESGILELFFQILGIDSISDELAVHSLRLIGNSCSDTDENRSRVVEGNALSLIIKRLANPRLVAVAVPVLFNICADFEPACQRARTDGLGATLIHLFHRNHLNSSPLRSYACRLLDICNEDFPLEDSPPFAAEALLLVASTPDVDVADRSSLVEAATQHLRLEPFQQNMLVQNSIQVPLQLLLRTCLRVSRSNTSGSDRSTASDTEEEEQLATLRASLVDVLSEISALQEFAIQYDDLNSPIIVRLMEWLSNPHSQLELCACLMLGNLARSDNVCRDMLARYSVHTSLISIVKTSSSPQVLHAALGFLRNLGLLAEHKEILGRSGVIEATTRFWKADTSPHVVQAAIALIRQILKDSVVNVQSMLAPLSTDPESPAHSRTQLSLLLLLFGRLDDAGAKMEIARLIAAILRCVHSSVDLASENLRDSLKHRLFGLHPDLAQPLAMMVTQNRWPIIRSEGWFALALTARSVEGASSIDVILKQVELFVALQSTIREETSVSEDSVSPMGSQDQVDAMKAKDRQNATILIHEFLQNTKNEDETSRRGGSAGSLEDRDVVEIFEDPDNARRIALEDLLNTALSQSAGPAGASQ